MMNDQRRARIEAAAHDVLAEKGYKSTTMLAIAKRARASNETLYRWYGSKAALFAELVKANAAEVRERLDATSQLPPLERLRAVAPILLAMVTGERAIALNRAAAADHSETGTLGPAIAAHGRDAVAPLIGAALIGAREEGAISFDDPKEAASDFINLLIGDLQVRRGIGAVAPLTEEETEVRAASAFAKFLKIYGGGK